MKYFILTITLFNLFSCEYKSPEEDKYPELPIFPQHTDKEVVITDFPVSTHGIYYNKDYIFTNNADSNLLILDRKFNQIKQTNVSVRLDYDITQAGEVYTVDKEDDVIIKLNHVYKMSPRNNFKKERVEILRVLSKDFYEIRDSINRKTKSLNEKEPRSEYLDSLINIAANTEIEKTKFKLNALKDGLISFFPLTNYLSILKYDNKEVALYSDYHHLDEFKDIDEKKRTNTLMPIWKLEQEPHSYGKVVLGNSWSGNHYVGGYNNYGYNYIELKIKNTKTKFKAHNVNNGAGVNILYKSSDTIVLKDNRGKLYYATLRK